MDKGVGGLRWLRLSCAVYLQQVFLVVSQRDLRGEHARCNALRKPQRITITIPRAVYEDLGELSFRQGRSMSNLASFMLEQAIQGHLQQ
jgi:hypothetical protein